MTPETQAAIEQAVAFLAVRGDEELVPVLDDVLPLGKAEVFRVLGVLGWMVLALLDRLEEETGENLLPELALLAHECLGDS